MKGARLSVDICMNKIDFRSASTPRLGRHILADFHHAHNLTLSENAQGLLSRAASAANATVLDLRLHDFGDGYGYTCFALLAESHISIHTWPEHSYVAIDVFMCGQADAEQALAVLRDYFKPEDERIQILDRGRLPEAANPQDPS